MDWQGEYRYIVETGMLLSGSGGGGSRSQPTQKGALRLAETQPGKPPRLSRSEMTEFVQPNDANILGNMMGGRVMHLIDVCAAMTAMRHTGRPCVTASMERLDFIRPIRLGSAVVLKGVVHWAGRTSVEVGVDVFAENLLTGERWQTCSAILVFVALDEHGRPAAVPPVEPETDAEGRLFAEAAGRAAQRRGRPPAGTP